MNVALFQLSIRKHLGTAKKLLLIITLLGLAGLVGYLLPSKLRPYVPALRCLDALLTGLFALLSWELFQLFVPARNFYSKKWRILRLVCVPLIWGVFVLIVMICLGRIKEPWPSLDEMYTLFF